MTNTIQTTTLANQSAIYKMLTPQALQDGELESIVTRMKTSILREWDFLADDMPAKTTEPEIFVGLQRIAPYNVTVSVIPINVPPEERIEACEWIAQEVTIAYKRAYAVKLNNEGLLSGVKS
jgi:hypothetical protein